MLLEFYGRGCSHCRVMAPLVKKLEEEFGITVDKYETWHDERNTREMEKYDTGLCGGVPFFFNTATAEFICGEASYEDLVRWARGTPEEKK